jgi:2-phospho-L-lactate/phosphoenolpyruvate guanylyltransferase
MTVTWTVVIPVKVLARAKSRLGVLAGARRPELALAMAADTVCAVLGCQEVGQVLVVSSDTAVADSLAPLGVTVVGEPTVPAKNIVPAKNTVPAAAASGTTPLDRPEDGLNAALVHGATTAAGLWPGTGIVALSADLPALRPAELGRALRAAGALPGRASFVADAQDVGTTLYAAPPGTRFDPMFGGASRRRHAAGGVCELLLDGIPGLRRDVDTPEDLRMAVALGTGTRTMAVAGELLGAA